MATVLIVIFISFLFVGVTLVNNFLGLNKIVVGTINSKTMSEKTKIENNGFEIMHADQLRNKGVNYEKAGKIIFRKFLFYGFFGILGRYLFTSNPKFLKLKFLKALTFIIDARVTYKENVYWAKNLSIEEILEFIPEYFEQGQIFIGHPYQIEALKAQKRLDVFLEELERYKKERPNVFLSEKKFDFGYLGTIIPNN